MLIHFQSQAMIDPNRPMAHEPELLNKVLPVTAMFIATHWTCPTCGISVRGSPPRVCLDERSNCPIGGAS